MQAQSTRTEAATTAAQSVVAVQTLLKASLGCITFLRDLLPSDNFTDSHFTSDDSFLSQPSDSNRSFDSTRSNSKNVNGFRIMTMTRGYTDEADRILNYLEYGIFDALQKQYLRSFIFAIYLDEKDPNNIVEAYTFNFQYHKLPGTNTMVPIMSLGETLDKMSLKDPVVQAAQQGKAPTLKDVKKSVKTVLKTLIHSTTQMDVLPKRRFAAFKLFYTDETPSDYEPPHFKSGDADKDKWYFMTHDLDEVPDRWNVGQLDTGHHSINLSVASIATYLPSCTENDNATFTGTTTRGLSGPAMTPAEEAAFRADQAEKQTTDAETRNIVWSADASVEGIGNNTPVLSEDVVKGDGEYVPVGIRKDDGAIAPVPAMEAEEAHFGGATQTVPTRLEELNAQNKLADVDMDQTQTLDINQLGSGLQPSLPASSIMTTETEIDTQVLQDLVLNNQAFAEDSEMLDMETQVVEDMDPIQSLQSIDSSMVDQIEEDQIEEDLPTPKPAKKKRDVVDRGMRCECDVDMDGDTCLCGDCSRRYHVWCMGFHSPADSRIPEDFTCFDCRARADNSWELIQLDLYPQMLSKFKDLALFRRAIKVVETYNPEVVLDFAKRLGCNNVLARQLFKRLENEGFIQELLMEVNDIGFAEAKPGKSKSKAKAKPRKNVQKTKYTFNRACLSSPAYNDYFNPDPRVESRLLDVPKTKANVKSHRPLPTSLPRMETFDESQTQAETQAETQIRPSKRLHSDDEPRPKKKVKISLAPAVDLAE